MPPSSDTHYHHLHPHRLEEEEERVPTTGSNAPPIGSPSSLPYNIQNIGSTASLIDIIKAAALSSIRNSDESLDFHSLNHQESTSDSEDIEDLDPEGQRVPPISDGHLLQSTTSKTSSLSSSGSIRSLEQQEILQSSHSNHHHSQENDPHTCQATRLVINRLASTLIPYRALSTSRFENKYRPHSQSNDNHTPPRSTVLPLNPLPCPTTLPSSHSNQPTDEFEIGAAAADNDDDENPSSEDQPSTSDDQHLQFLIDHFGVWSGKDPHGQPETETWIKQVPGILTRSVLVQGLILLTNRRLCFNAYLPSIEMGEIIRSGTATLQANSPFYKRIRCWIELRTDSITQYKSSTKPFRPVSSIHLSEVKSVLPITPARPKTLRLRLSTGRLVYIEFDTAEATTAWHKEFVTALFNFKAHHSHQIKIVIPLRRIRKLHRSTFENIAKVMNLDVDSDLLNEMVDNDIVEQNLTHEDFDRTQIQLSYFLDYGHFDDLILDAIARAKLEISKAQSGLVHQTPSPLLEVTLSSHDKEEGGDKEVKSLDDSENEGSLDNSSLALKFAKAFGLEAHSKLPIYHCSFLRTFPLPGHVAICKDYLCFWHRGIRLISADYKFRIPLKRVGKLKPTSAFGFHRYGLAIELAGSPDIRLDFTSKSTRQEVIEVLNAAAQDASWNSSRLSGLKVKFGKDANPNEAKIDSAISQSGTLPVCFGVDSGPVPRPLRIVCLTIGSRGDVQPYISLAKRLMQDGHTVTIASHPEYRSWIESFGILYKDVGGDPAALMNFSVEHNFFSTGFFKEGLNYFKTWLDNLLNDAWLATKDSEAELLIESPSTFAGIHIAEGLRIPYFRAFTMTWTSTATYPQAFASNIDLGPSYNLLSYSLFDSLIWRAMSGQINRWRQNTLLIPPTSLEKMQAYKVPFLYNFSSVVVPKPLDWRDHIDVTGYWFLDQSHGNYKPPEALSKFIASAKEDNVPLVYIGFGSVTVPDSAAVTKAIYGAVVQAGVRAIVAKGWSDRLEAKSLKIESPPPPEVHVLQAIPHDWLFPQLDAVCHHGGAGTTGISLRFGLPTIIHPFFGDQPFWADRVSRLGAGLKIDSLSVHTISEALKKATSDRTIRQKAQQVGERIQAEDGPGRAVQFIYQYLDFALERTMHRIERTQPKKSKPIKLRMASLNSYLDSSIISGAANRESVIRKKFSRRGKLMDRSGGAGLDHEHEQLEETAESAQAMSGTANELKIKAETGSQARTTGPTTLIKGETGEPEKPQRRFSTFEWPCSVLRIQPEATDEPAAIKLQPDPLPLSSNAPPSSQQKLPPSQPTELHHRVSRRRSLLSSFSGKTYLPPVNSLSKLLKKNSVEPS